MKGIFAFCSCVFWAVALSGCAAMMPAPEREEPYVAQPAPEVKAPPKPAPKPKEQRRAEVAAKVVPRKEPVTEIVTDNLYPIPKFVDANNDFSILSMTPVAYSAQGPCNEVYFFEAVVTPASGYHGIVDITMSEYKTDNAFSCKYFGTAIVYKVKPNPFVKEIIKIEDVIRKEVTD